MGLRGGTADAIEREASSKFATERLNLAKQRWAMDTSARARMKALSLSGTCFPMSRLTFTCLGQLALPPAVVV